MQALAYARGAIYPIPSGEGKYISYFETSDYFSGSTYALSQSSSSQLHITTSIACSRATQSLRGLHCHPPELLRDHRRVSSPFLYLASKTPANIKSAYTSGNLAYPALSTYVRAVPILQRGNSGYSSPRLSALLHLREPADTIFSLATSHLFSESENLITHVNVIGDPNEVNFLDRQRREQRLGGCSCWFLGLLN